VLEELGLPEHLKERCIVRSNNVREHPSFVLHWMRTAIRLDECPTFDTAVHIASTKDVPLLIYHGIDERYPQASYRHHRFLLEGAADVADRAESLSVDHIVHVSRKGTRGPYLLDLAKESGLVITDMVDLDPWISWTEKLIGNCCLVEVDSHCVLPRPIFGKTIDRPFRFREATKKQMRIRASLNWPRMKLRPKRMPNSWNPPFSPVDVRLELAKDGGAELMSGCDIDPTVVPVNELKGGTSSATERWLNWCKTGLRRYHLNRNNAALSDGVSGMSPWIHYGMISVTQIVRETSEIGGKGAEKFLEEMLVFREHAQHHAHALNHPEKWSHIPEWAISSWADRTGPISELSPMQLERSSTGDVLWDSAQTGLLRHGTMHNNVRMTWGKAFANWIKDPEEAMKIALDQNNRFALDGRDPSSIAGVQWCFGLFDRAFGPVDPVMGKIRKRPTLSHLNRLDITKYVDITNRPSGGMTLDVGIIGGGLSGMFAARLLTDLGHKVTIWDKGARIGGRLTGWNTESGDIFHLGSRSLDSIPRWMIRFAEEWARLGYVKLKGSTLVPLKPIPELLNHLSQGSEVHLSHKIIDIDIVENGVRLTKDFDGHVDVSTHDKVIVAVPVEQAMEIASWLGLEIMGQSYSKIVSWGPTENKPQMVPEGYDLMQIDNTTSLVELSSDISDKLIDNSLEDITKIISESMGLSTDGWKSHKWRYSTPFSGPKSVVSKDCVSFIGDAFGLEIGTSGAALDSAARAVSNLHLTKFTSDFRRSRIQASIFDW